MGHNSCQGISKSCRGLGQKSGYHRIFFTFLEGTTSGLTWLELLSAQNVEKGHFHHLTPYDFSTLFSDL